MAKRRELLSAIGGGIVTAGVMSGTGAIEISEDVDKEKIKKELEEDISNPAISTVSGSLESSSVEFTQGFTQEEGDLLVYFLVKNQGSSPIKGAATLNFLNGGTAVVQEQVDYSIAGGETRIFTFGKDKSNDDMRKINVLEII